MSTDYTIKKPSDLSKINSNDVGELLWWSYYLGTSPETLLCIISKAGNASEQVRKLLKEGGSS